VREEFDVALVARLRTVLSDRHATEADLRTLAEQADAWARTMRGQMYGSERRLEELMADPASALVEIGEELRRVEQVGAQLRELQLLVTEFGERAHRLRQAWLADQGGALGPSDRGDSATS
jgi:hypothetical protein